MSLLTCTPIPPTPRPWQNIASDLRQRELGAIAHIIVPTAANVEEMKADLQAAGVAFLCGCVRTLPMCLASLPPSETIGVAAEDSHRLMLLYAELRKHTWVKDLFGARSNVDLFPLAQTLLGLCNELSLALLPTIDLNPDAARERWQQALEQLPAPVRTTLSDEAQLVWTVWKSLLDSDDPASLRMYQLSALARSSTGAVVWVADGPLSPMEQWFLDQCATRNRVAVFMPGWHPNDISPLLAESWPEILDENAQHESAPDNAGALVRQPALSLISARSLEEEAQKGAQTIVDWLQGGVASIAIVAQDRAVARRIRALLERAQVFVADETGWKLSTTRAAAALTAIYEVATPNAKSAAILELLKSPFVLGGIDNKLDYVMVIEAAIRKQNVTAGWIAIRAALGTSAVEVATLETIETAASVLTGHKTISGWATQTLAVLHDLQMADALAEDAAGAQIIQILERLAEAFADSIHELTPAEWRAFLSLRLEAEAYIAPGTDTRVTMLPLAGTRFRRFDAVLLVGADADHLPSRMSEVLFFANAVRRELGLLTREQLQRQQMRDLSQLIMSGSHLVLSRQTHRNGERVAASPWIERLQLTLACAGKAPIEEHTVRFPQSEHVTAPPTKAGAAAPELVPQTLSPSGFNSLTTCPYQFFASHMLKLVAYDDVSEAPEKRVYGNWLHEILNTFHIAVRDRKVPDGDQSALLAEISETIFSRELAKTPAATGYYARWKKVMPTYLAWAQERHACGWRFLRGEQRLEKTLNWEGGSITLIGRVDRLDGNDAGEQAVIDYKTSSLASLTTRLKDREDHQLPFYALLSDAHVVSGEYVSLEATAAGKTSVPAKDFEEWQSALQDRIAKNLMAIKRGDTIPANGGVSACGYCDVRGLCRNRKSAA